MTILNTAIIIFIILESLNIIILYFAPDSKRGNGISIFKQWEKSKENTTEHLFAQYMKNWVAGSKLIFIMLLIIILFEGSELLKFYTLIALIVSISTYFLKLKPIIDKLDALDEISPKGYSNTLTQMIFGFIFIFGLACGLYIFV